jgi:hypothetical protein
MEKATAAAGAMWVTDWKRTSRSPIAFFARAGSLAAVAAIGTSLGFRCLSEEELRGRIIAEVRPVR